MPQEYLIIDILQGMAYVVALCLIGIILKLALTPPKRRSMPEDADFDAFYCHLCASCLTVDFSREEAQVLYRTWQWQQKIEDAAL